MADSKKRANLSKQTKQFIHNGMGIRRFAQLKRQIDIFARAIQLPYFRIDVFLCVYSFFLERNRQTLLFSNQL